MNKALTHDMRTHAIGRLLFDLPAGFEMRIGSDVELIYGLTNDFEVVKAQLIEAGVTDSRYQMIAIREQAELSKQRHTKTGGSTLVHASQASERTLLLRSFADPLLVDSYVSRVVILVGDVVVDLRQDVYHRQDPEIIEERLLRLASQIERADDPTKPGRGFVLGPILINGDHDHEVGTLSYADPAVPEVNLKLMMRALTENPEETLLRRFDSKKHLLVGMPGKLKTLRRGKIAVAERYGEEMLNEVIVDGERKTWTFDAEVIRDQPAFSAPLLNIYFTLGRQVKSEHMNPSWSEAEATAVWDAMLKSLRARPGAV